MHKHQSILGNKAAREGRQRLTSNTKVRRCYMPTPTRHPSSTGQAPGPLRSPHATCSLIPDHSHMLFPLPEYLLLPYLPNGVLWDFVQIAVTSSSWTPTPALTFLHTSGVCSAYSYFSTLKPHYGVMERWLQWHSSFWIPSHETIQSN